LKERRGGVTRIGSGHVNMNGSEVEVHVFRRAVRFTRAVEELWEAGVLG
jgi:hypothetical protein